MKTECKFLEKTESDGDKFDWGKKYAMEKLVDLIVSVLHPSYVRRESEKNIGM